ncbi:MAG: polyribonucleotide nucleotidyltransferase [Acholeplasmataceae bacterium]|nr:polyribonucleotide nucleotidyltransferase [Acholeplasmataceae bacterium]
MNKKIFKTTSGGKPLIVEIGEVARQTNGSVLVQYGDSVVLSVAVSKEDKTPRDYFPLMVLYQEKLYAAGKIPGGFLRREGRPSEHEILTSRLIDRPLRPLFLEGYNDEVQVINTVLSSDPTASPEMAALFGSSLALHVSDIPFKIPVSAVNIGRINNEFVINPSLEEMAESDLDLIVAGTKDAINMVEASAKEVSEEVMLEALMLAHEEIKKLCQFQEDIRREVGKDKQSPMVSFLDLDVYQLVRAEAYQKLVKTITIKEKLERALAVEKVKAEVLEKFEQQHFFTTIDGNEVYDYESKDNYIKQVKQALEKIEQDEIRRLIIEEKIRPDGRKADEIRPLYSKIDLLPRVHGSALFTRGQTQSLGTTTLGSLGENQIIDGLDPTEETKRFMFHYNFPQFSVGETGRYGAPGRREVGHGALAEKALLQVLPDEDEFPYSIRVVSEILESNGSSSQASICSGTMSLMAAGVPIKAPVAGIAMGLVMDGKKYTILTDILGLEDHFGDMDFKVAGTKEGITALQMDIKIDGITKTILHEALMQAKRGRLEILEHMTSIIAEPRAEVSKYAPKVVMIKINPDKIKEVIGPGGKIITQIIEDCGDVKIDIEQDGRVYIMHQEQKWIDQTIKRIEDLTREVEIGKIYEGKVVRIERFGAFVELWPGTEGLVHISKLAKERVESVESVVAIGDVILVKCIKIDDKGRIDLSRKDAL